MSKVYTVYQYCREGIERGTFSTKSAAYDYAFEYIKETVFFIIRSKLFTASEDDMLPSLAEKIMKMEPKEAVLAWNAWAEKNTYGDDYYLEVEEVTVNL